jgi:hypothetical protein
MASLQCYSNSPFIFYLLTFNVAFLINPVALNQYLLKYGCKRLFLTSQLKQSIFQNGIDYRGHH